MFFIWVKNCHFCSFFINDMLFLKRTNPAHSTAFDDRQNAKPPNLVSQNFSPSFELGNTRKQRGLS